jgi:hypothetical protein
MDKPYYKHDCTACIFLGGCFYQSDRYDLYACRQDIGGYTVIARWGSEGPDYTSGVSFAERHLRENPNHPLAVALKRVIDAVRAGSLQGVEARDAEELLALG